MLMIFKDILESSWKNMVNNSEESKPYLTILGYNLIIVYPLFYFLNHLIFIPNNYEDLFLRVIIGVFGLMLVLFKYWPEYLKKMLPIIFYSIMLISFPFFFSYMFYYL